MKESASTVPKKETKSRQYCTSLVQQFAVPLLLKGEDSADLKVNNVPMTKVNYLCICIPGSYTTGPKQWYALFEHGQLNPSEKPLSLSDSNTGN